MRSRYPVDRINLAIETSQTPMHIGALTVAEGGRLLDESGRLRLSEVRLRRPGQMEANPALRRRVCDPGLFRGAPLWLDDPDFSIERHVRVLAVPPPGEEVQLLEAAARLLRPPLDRSRPLWELWFLTGLAEGQVGVLLKLHHAVADGLAAVALMSSLFDLEPEPGGLRDLLVQRGERVDGMNLQARVPVGAPFERRRQRPRERDGGHPRGATDGRAGRGAPSRPGGGGGPRGEGRPASDVRDIVHRPAGGFALGRPFIARQRLVNVFVTNVPGPQLPIYVLGSRTLDVIPISPLSGNVTVTFGAFSYCSRLDVAVVADAGWNDVNVLVSGLRRAWTELEADAGQPRQPPTV